MLSTSSRSRSLPACWWPQQPLRILLPRSPAVGQRHRSKQVHRCQPPSHRSDPHPHPHPSPYPRPRPRFLPRPRPRLRPRPRRHPYRRLHPYRRRHPRHRRHARRPRSRSRWVVRRWARRPRSRSRWVVRRWARRTLRASRCDFAAARRWWCGQVEALAPTAPPHLSTRWCRGATTMSASAPPTSTSEVGRTAVAGVASPRRGTSAAWRLPRPQPAAAAAA